MPLLKGMHMTDPQSAAPEVISLGNLLVEVMRVQLDQPLDRPGEFVGPYPSGDAVIYIDTVARLGHSGGYIGAVGRDDFGRCLLDRLAQDGVNCSGIRVLEGHTTGVAFVAYFGDGSRKFIFHWRHAAAGQLAPDFVQPDYFRNAAWLHLSGCNLAVSEAAREAGLKAMRCLPAGARVSFDPNIRPEVLSVDEIRDLVEPVVRRADLIVPSLSEAAMLTGAPTDEAGCRMWARQGKLVVLKQGAAGCRVFYGQEDFQVPAFPVVEVDPTGAGDSFSAAFSVALLEGMALREAGRFANAVGALAVGKKGPMEGAPTRREVTDFITRYAV
jgi:sugar/nucleoside kinase (ribokinase family)